MPKGQSRLGSFAESWINVVVGIVINYVAGLVIYPYFGFHVTLLDNLYVSLAFTVTSVARSYMLRRAFNLIQEKR